MKTITRVAFFACTVALLLTPSPTALARATGHFYTVDQALTEGTDKEPDAKIPV